MEQVKPKVKSEITFKTSNGRSHEGVVRKVLFKLEENWEPGFPATFVVGYAVEPYDFFSHNAALFVPKEDVISVDRL